MTRIADYRDLGFLPLQDHGQDVVTGRRQQVVGCRIVTMDDATTVGGDPTRSTIEIGAENGMGTLGDVHPWLFWQTSARGARASGSYAQVFAGIVDDDRAGGGAPTTGSGAGAATFPIGSFKQASDIRYAPKKFLNTKGMPPLVKGCRVVVLPATDETEQHEVQLPADGRLWAPHVGTPAEAGTLVVDLQPDGVACMDNSVEPGIGGRHARLQSALRVVPFELTGNRLGGRGNGLALNFALTGQESMLGYGLIWSTMDSSNAGPITGGGSQSPPITGGGSSPSSLVDDVSDDSLGKRPFQFGRYYGKPIASHGSALLAAIGGRGPIHAGHCGGDKHLIDFDRDGNPMNSGHVHVGALWYRNAREDGPMLFEGDYPHPNPLPLQSPVHLGWDNDTDHPWIDGPRSGYWRWWAEVPYIVPATVTPRPPTGGPPTSGPRGGPRGPMPGSPGPGGPRPGKSGSPRAPASPPVPGGGPAPGTGGPPPWTPRFEPVDPQGAGGRTPAPLPPMTGSPGKFPDFLTPPERIGVDPAPGGPITPGGSSGPGVPNAPEGGSPMPVPPPWGQFPDPWTPRVGGNAAGDRSLFVIHHPFMESWSAQAVRPQLWVEGAPNWEHSQHASAEAMQAEEVTRPQVLGVRSWGAQSGEAWDYAILPDDSRARGGVADGGLLFCPPEFEPEDYLLSGSELSVDSPSTTSYVTAAPGVAFALGKPATDGGLAAASVTISQAATGNRTFSIKQLNASRVATSLLSASVDQSSGEIVMQVHGTAALRIPLGGDAQRTASPGGGEIRVSNAGTRDVLEFYDSQTATWREVVPSPDSPAEGSMMVYSSGQWIELAVGSDGDVLTMVGGVPAWTAPTP